jgi:Copper type II ascorbate-dependent monooxygenase, C-terminal domain
MHMAGTRVTNEHIRNGTVIRTASTEVWDFNQNGNVPVKQDPYEIHAGDSFRTSCFYRDNQNTIFGLSSRQEMCMGFLYYYPRKVFKVDMPQGSFSLPLMCGLGMEWLDNACLANYTPGGVSESDDDLQRVFGRQNTECLIATDGTSDVIVDVTEESPEEPTGLLRGTPTPAPQAEEEEEEDNVATAKSEGSPLSVSGTPGLALRSMHGALLALVVWLM